MSAAQKRKWARQDKAIRDKAQATFGGEISELKLQPVKKVESQLSQIPLDKKVLCPFCLIEAELKSFLVSTKDGISQSKAHCKHCEQGFMMRNLLRPWTAKDYAAFVFGYRKAGFFNKIKQAPNSFEKWMQRLKDLGWSRDFWDRYKAMKAAEQPWEDHKITEEDQAAYDNYVASQTGQEEEI